MNSEVRLAEIVEALRALPLRCLVMGGHAARYYGILRSTIDYDLVVATDHWERLGEMLRGSAYFAGDVILEGNSWRPGEFCRFLIGQLPDGRDEWLEFWRRNHLLPNFDELFARAEFGLYGGKEIPFLALPDLIRSKETERASDWQDIELLEEILDERMLSAITRGGAAEAALAALRSRKGFERALTLPQIHDRQCVAAAYAHTASPITRAFLRPWVDAAALSDQGIIGEIINVPLARIEPGSAKHLALVEAVRRLAIMQAGERDRGDKERVRGARPS